MNPCASKAAEKFPIKNIKQITRLKIFGIAKFLIASIEFVGTNRIERA